MPAHEAKVNSSEAAPQISSPHHERTNTATLADLFNYTSQCRQTGHALSVFRSSCRRRRKKTNGARSEETVLEDLKVDFLCKTTMRQVLFIFRYPLKFKAAQSPLRLLSNKIDEAPFEICGLWWSRTGAKRLAAKRKISLQTGLRCTSAGELCQHAQQWCNVSWWGTERWKRKTPS